MTFINDKDRAVLRQEFQELVQPVKLVLFEGPDCEHCGDAKQLLEEIAALSDKITIETHDLANKEKAAQFQIDKAPAIAVMNGKDYGIRYFGIPSGYEFGSLIDDILDMSKGESGLSPETKAALATLTQPIHFQVFVTPTCPYCPRAVRTAHKMAMESEWVRADMIEATEFPELSERYEVMAVPRIVINDTSYFEGALPEAQFLAAALQTLESDSRN
ncbi:MAG TPA: thioredoxin family protein [Anaerolineae bacterium]